MKMRMLMLVLLFAAAGTVKAQEPTVTPILTKELAGVSGKEVLLLIVDYAPGTTEHIHRHNANAFVYVLEGTIVMQVQGGKEVTLTAGQTFYEGPNDIHTVGRNASSSKPAKFVVFLVKNQGAPAVLPVEDPGEKKSK